MSNIKKLKPDTPARRFMSVSTFEEITTSKPERKEKDKDQPCW